MSVLRASCTRLWMRFLIQLVYISCITFDEARSAENGRTTHLLETRSAATILESKQNYIPNLWDIFNRKNSNLSCTQEFSNLNTNQAEKFPSSNSTFSRSQHRIKRCLLEYRAKLKSKILETRSKLQQQVEELKNKRSARPLETRAFPKSVSDNQRRMEGQPMIDEKISFQTTKETRNESSTISLHNSVSTESVTNSSLTSYQTEKYGNEMFFDNRNNIKTTKSEKMLDEYPKISDTNLEEIMPTISNQTTSFESFDTISVESENNPIITSDISNLLTDSSTSSMDTESSREMNQSNFKTIFTEQPTKETTPVVYFEEIHNSTTPTLESNSPRPDLDFLSDYKSISKISNARNPLTPSYYTSDSKGEWMPQISKLEPLNNSGELNLSENTPDLEQDSATSTDTIFSSPISQLPQEIVARVNGSEQNVSSDRPNQTRNSDDNSNEAMIEQNAISTNTQKRPYQMNNIEHEAIQEIPDQTKNNEQSQILSPNSLPQTTYPAPYTMYGNHQPEMQMSDSLSTQTNFLLATETTKSQPEIMISTQVHGGQSKTENSVPGSTDFTREIENLSEDHSQVLVKKSLRYLPKLPMDENSHFSTATMLTDPPNRHTPKKYKLKHFSNNLRKNLFERSHLGSKNSIFEDQKSSHLPTDPLANTLSGYDHPSITESPPIDSTFESDFENNWTNSTDSANKTETYKNFSSIFRQNFDSYPQNLVNPKAMGKTHKIQPGEVMPPMNPNENWKIGENDTYYTIEELRSFIKMKKKNPAAGQNMNNYSPEIVIDLNGLNETTIIDFLKHNLTSAHQNETISFNTTKYKTFKLFSNSTYNFHSNGAKNESSNSALIYSLIPQEDLYQRINSSKNASAISNSKSDTSKYLIQLEENLFNSTTKDEKAIKFFQELLSLNKEFLTNTNENFSNSIGTEKDKSTENTEVIFLNLKEPQSEKELLQKIISGCNKIVVIADNNATLLRNVQNVNMKKKYAEDSVRSIKEFSISEKKNLVERKNVDDIKGKINITGRSVSFSEKGMDNANENDLLGPHYHFKAKHRDPQEQLIKKQFNFVNPQVVDNFLDVYKHYSPQHSASKSKMTQHNHANNARSSEDIDRIPKPQHSYRNELSSDVIGNLLRELVRLKNSVPAAYISHE